MKIILIAVSLVATLAVGLWALPTQNKTTLSWNAVTTNMDGTPATDLAGYKIYWSTTSGTYTNVNMKDVGNVLTANIQTSIGSLKGTYYFVVTAYDTTGNESDFSNEVSATFVNKKKAPTNLTVQ